jgi:hypothetical protein
MNMHPSRIVLLLALSAIFLRMPAQAGEIVRVSRDNRALLPHGKEADGMAGDWLIRNDKVAAVIGAASPYREANQMVSSIQGAVIDFTSRAADNDQLVVYYPQGARRRPCCRYHPCIAGKRPGSAIKSREVCHRPRALYGGDRL